MFDSGIVSRLLLVFVCGLSATQCIAQERSSSYQDLVALFRDWREFESPPLLDGAPDYTADRFVLAYRELPDYRARLSAIDYSGWPLEQQVDWHIVRAELNGFDFNHRILKPWVRDPAFYQSIWTAKSDVPAHEGPTHHAVVELWTYEFPLTDQEQQRLTNELAVIAPLMKQAQLNLTGNARELWIAGIENIRRQRDELGAIESMVAAYGNQKLNNAISAAQSATESLIAWLESESENKTGPSGIGKGNYTWYQQNVHYVPLTWEQEVDLLKRELDRAWANLALEEHRNRNLPQLVAISSPEEYERRADQAATQLISFLRDNEVMYVKDNMEPALREHLGEFVPEENRNFFWIGVHYDPTPLYTHFYHWWELAQMRDEPHASPIRRGPMLYNIFDSRNEGTATGVEEMFMHAGLYDDNPRVREIVWIMLAQRAARGLGSLYAQANMMTMEEAGGIHVEWTPRGWMSTEPELLKFEQHLYMRQPGYGTSYITGKYLLERLLAVRRKQAEESGEPFVLADFFAELNDAGSVPISLAHWQLTGYDNDVRALGKN